MPISQWPAPSVLAGWVTAVARQMTRHMWCLQVYIQEDEEQRIHFKNLSVHRAASEEEALNLVGCSSGESGELV